MAHDHFAGIRLCKYLFRDAVDKMYKMAMHSQAVGRMLIDLSLDEHVKQTVLNSCEKIKEAAYSVCHLYDDMGIPCDYSASSEQSAKKRKNWTVSSTRQLKESAFYQPSLPMWKLLFLQRKN